MLSLTAASLSRKDVLIADAESKVTSMTKIIDSLTNSNAQLMHRIGQLESSLAAGYAGDSASSGTQQKSGGSSASTGWRHDVQFERIDTLIAQDDERMDRINRMLLETMFGMARMVESCAIQMSKDVMDSLEYQLDGSVLQNLAEMVRGMLHYIRVGWSPRETDDGPTAGSWLACLHLLSFSLSLSCTKIQAENQVKAKAEASESRGSTPSANTDAEQLRRPMAGTDLLGPDTSLRGSSRGSAGSSSSSSSSRARGSAVQIKDLANLPIDSFLLHWFRMNLQMSSAIEKASDRTIKNFTSDLSDGRRFSFLLHRLFPTWFDTSVRTAFRVCACGWMHG